MVITALSQPRVGDIYVERKNVFDSTEADYLKLGSLMNSLHIKTKEYIVRDELLFERDDPITEEILIETERNLRQTGLFTSVEIFLDSVGFDYYDVYVVTKDRWSTSPALLFGTGGGVSNFGGKLSENNFLGTGTEIEVQALNRTENDIRWQGMAYLNMLRFFRTQFNLEAMIQANRFRTDQFLNFADLYRNTRDEYSYGINLTNNFGQDFLYFNKLDSFRLMNFHERIGKAYFSKAWIRKSRLFFTGLVEYNVTDRGAPEQRRIYDNSGKILLQFSSLSQDFTTINKINEFRTEDLAVGGYGRVILGRIFPIGSRGEQMYYLAGQGEQSYFNGETYLYGQITAGSGFVQSDARYTYQEFYGSGFHRLSDKFLLAGRFRQQTTWNWTALRQLILDNDFGLRGFEANRFSGENRILANMEVRFFPEIDLWVADLAAAAFFDIGTVWDQSEQIQNLRFYKSAGLGLRLHSRKTTGANSIFRFDVAYNIDDNKFGGIIFTTNQLFSPMLDHIYKLPQIFGIEFDNQ